MYCSSCGKQIADDAKFCPSCGHPVGVTTSLPSGTGFDKLTSDSEAQAHWVARLVAFVIDLILVGIVASVIFFFTVVVPNIFLAFGLTWAFYSGVLMFLYATVMEGLYGATVGKRVMGLHVALENGGRPTLTETLIRNVAKIYWVLLLLDIIVGLLTPGDYRQRYTDRLAKTVVVK